jgi:hypothetical protein
MYDPAAPDKMIVARQDLDEKRKQAVMAFVNAQTAGQRGEFRVIVHDPAEVGLSSNAVGSTVTQMYGRFRGGLVGGGGGVGAAASVTGGAGAGAPAGGAGAGGGPR